MVWIFKSFKFDQELQNEKRKLDKNLIPSSANGINDKKIVPLRHKIKNIHFRLRLQHLPRLKVYRRDVTKPKVATQEVHNASDPMPIYKLPHEKQYAISR